MRLFSTLLYPFLRIFFKHCPLASQPPRIETRKKSGIPGRFPTAQAKLITDRPLAVGSKVPHGKGLISTRLDRKHFPHILGIPKQKSGRNGHGGGGRRHHHIENELW